MDPEVLIFKEQKAKQEEGTEEREKSRCYILLHLQNDASGEAG